MVLVVRPQEMNVSQCNVFRRDGNMTLCGKMFKSDTPSTELVLYVVVSTHSKYSREDADTAVSGYKPF